MLNLLTALRRKVTKLSTFISIIIREEKKNEEEVNYRRKRAIKTKKKDETKLKDKVAKQRKK